MTALPRAASVLAVCAHPDDESFGLGALLSAFDEDGIKTSVLCFTRGEASALGAEREDLASVRAAEFEAAARVLRVRRQRLLSYPDGALAGVDLDELVAHVRRFGSEVGADLLLAFDEGGITGHPDHIRATQAATRAADADGYPVLAWAVPDEVARALNEELGTGFLGRRREEIDLVVTVDRSRQIQAIACHRSQSAGNPVPRRRMEMTGLTEWMRWLRGGPTAQ
ncbi:MAG: PIG-L family deacetylase [Acidobacteria bacterium]|nr:PIG-L family deacetylase [Acidobacteriota bacterium]